MTKAEQKRADALLDPVKFQHVWLGRRLWRKQQEIIRAVYRYPVVSVKGCHASGKTHQAAGIPLHWITRFPQSEVFITAPTQRQVKTFFQQLALARKGGIIRNLLPEPTTLQLKVSDERQITGASASDSVNLQGKHSPNMLIIVDEAPGVPAANFDAIEGIRAGGNVRMLKLGNPVVPAGNFYDDFGKNRAACYGISISAFDTPNMQNEFTGEPLTLEELEAMSEDRLDFAPYPFLITRRWVRERMKVWGVNHPKFQSRVLAEFPRQSPYSVFELGWIERAKRDSTAAELAQSAGSYIQVGIDVAGPGDDETTLCARVNGIIIHQQAWPDSDPVGGVLAVLGQLARHPLYRLGAVVVDTVGIGYNFALRLVDAGFGPYVFGFVGNGRALDAAMFRDAKSEAYFAARDWLKAGLVSGLSDDECEAQLSTMLYRENSRGLTEIWSKDEMRSKFGVQSPDRAEALIMAFCRIVPAEQQIDAGIHYQISPI
jgi:hypothetical protein